MSMIPFGQHLATDGCAAISTALRLQYVPGGHWSTLQSSRRPLSTSAAGLSPSHSSVVNAADSDADTNCSVRSSSSYPHNKCTAATHTHTHTRTHAAQHFQPSFSLPSPFDIMLFLLSSLTNSERPLANLIAATTHRSLVKFPVVAATIWNALLDNVVSASSVNSFFLGPTEKLRFTMIFLLL